MVVILYYNRRVDYLHDVSQRLSDGDEYAATFYFSDFFGTERIYFDELKEVVVAFLGEQDIFDILNISYDVWFEILWDLSV